MPDIPKTLRLHLEDTFLLGFDATVLEARPSADGPLEVALDRTAFYVESGGQPADAGRLAGRDVLGVRLVGDVVWHRVDADGGADPFASGSSIAGEIDAARRLDHMQQHTGQHILSQAFIRAGERPTVSFHLGREECTIDLSGAQPDDALIEAVSNLANECVMADRPVRIHQVSRADLARYPVRRDPSAEHDVLRLIEIEDYDWSACGGTHAQRTGQVGPVQILGVEKSKAYWRIRFVAGRRALRYFAEAHRVLQEVARSHSIRWNAIPEAAKAWQDEAHASAKEVKRLRQELDEREGERLFAEAKPGDDGVRRLFSWLGEAAPDGLRARASRFTSLGPAVVLIGGSDGGRAHWVAARSKELPEQLSSWNAGKILRAWLEALGGKGGGADLFAQGTSRIPEEAEITGVRAFAETQSGA